MQTPPPAPTVTATVGRDGAVAVVDVAGTPPTASLNALVTALAGLATDVRAVLLRLPSAAADDPPHDPADVIARQHALGAVEDLPLPTVALLGRHCTGLALDLALCCDVRVAPADVVVAASGPAAGALPVGGTVARLVRATGQGVARDMLITGRTVDAADALAWGLVTRLAVDPAAVASGLATTLAGLSPEALAATKRLALGASQDTLTDGLAAELSTWHTVRTGANAQEGLSAFAEKRDPRFT
ncbi:enoyl-CoA hydratase/isomerase family protein [Pseudonocardia sp. N23]|uniref:enoyl-CoA hydratase/isomerase family protein n=1 Tax=Pseudonocardia sp. N23 TaxID=1987376 RepID=UPI000C035816|nr:enoyl-CoA hydratase/isomerase family protein [Pseudonocardia sp. N23]GAY11970.1 enoyl-CoA hydratase [Pseudonocardia sp. N23]